ncbi:T-complex protein 11-like protein 1 [Ambystoma mexicanum]|uniref:T-complex protein 11-like protein 1 n=1 Tax=Ambystoma mexicanum TaxID=8296 RepID=UPI0037E776DA
MPLDPDKQNANEAKASDSEITSTKESLDISDESVRKRIRQSTPSTLGGNTPQLSPPRLVSLEELMETTKGVTKMALAHEIVVNGDFKLKLAELPEGSLEKNVRDIVHKAFWDCLEVQFHEDPPTYGHAIILLGEIKETLNSFLLPAHTRIRNQINEVLDLDLIKQEAENGVLDISKLVKFIIDMMGTLCAPARDEDIRKLKDIKEIVPLFRELFSVLDLMKIDMANFAVSSIRPHLMQQSVEYERQKFQDFFEKQPNSLEFVTKWLQEAADELAGVKHEDPPCSDVGAVAVGRVPSLSRVDVLNHAYLKLLKWDHNNTPFPETLLLDQTRFEEMQLELDQLTIMGTILLVTYNSAGSALSNLTGFIEKLKTVIKVLLTGLHLPSFNLNEAMATLSEKICAEVNICLSTHGFTPFSAEKETALRGQIRAAADPDNHVHKLIESRIRTYFKSRLSSSQQKSVPALPGGLGPIQKELEELAIRYVRFVIYNKIVFSPHYDVILSKILIKEGSI